MRADGSLCFESLQRLIEFHIQSGTAAVVLAGTTGESVTLSLEERSQLLQSAISTANGRIPVIAGTGTSDCRQSIEFSRQAEAEGADACMLVTPPYNRPSQEGMYRHFIAVADSVSLPVMLYNVPHRTACDLLPATVARLAQHPQIVAHKESLGGARFVELTKQLEDAGATHFKLYAGTDELLIETLDAGACGIVSVSANLVPTKIASICSLYADGKRNAATTLHEELMPLHQALFCEPSPTATKWALMRIGLIPKAEGIRLPLLPANEKTRRELLPLLASLN